MGEIIMKKFFLALISIFILLSAFPLNSFASSCGITGDCTWTLNGTVLTISGNGSMEFYSEYYQAPWGTGITDVVIEEGVKSIGDRAFFKCRGLKNITIPDSVTCIGKYALYNCAWLKNITIPDSVTSIGSHAFSDCKRLTSVTIPNSVMSIGNSAFSGCTGLTSITIPDGVTSIGDSAFSGCTGLTSVTIPNSVSNTADFAFEGCTGLTSVTLLDGVTSIARGIFASCTGLTSITIPSSVTSIGDKVFYGCTGLISITIPNSVTSIGAWAFSGCTGLTSIIIPDSVTSIGDGTFFDCTGLTSVTIPSGVTSIGDKVFYGCTGLISITIPNSVTSIGAWAFYRCSGLTSVTIPNSVIRIGYAAFSGCTGLTSITIPDGVMSIGPEAFSRCGLTSVTLPKSVKSIGGLAFDCISLTSITIPNSVTSIDKNAFSGCDKSRLTIYTDDISSAAYTYAKANGYRCVVLVDQAEGLQFAVTGNTLEIVGSGKMPNYNLFTSTPWYVKKDNITRIVIDSRITDVGTYSFYGFDKLEAVVTENPDLVFHQYALNTANTALTVYSYAGGTLEQYCNDNGVRFVAPLGTPTLLGVTENTITVKAESGLEYSLDKTSWRTDGVFTGLSPVTEYTVYVRRKNGYTPIEGTPLKVKTTKRVIAAPAAPAIQAYDATTVTLKPTAGYEYSKDGITWQQSNVFTGIMPNRIYAFRQRLAETDTDFASASSAPLYYAAPSKPEILSVGASTLTVKAVDGFEYSLDKMTWQKDPHFTALIYGMEYTVYQRIAKVDNADTYAVVSIGTTVLINGNDKKTPATPSAPVVESKTTDTVTLKKIAGYEYRMDDGAWQQSPVFAGLAPNSTHRFYQRVAETDAAYASDSSTALTVQLDPLFTRGDLDGDEEISDWDGVLLARYLAGWDVNVSNADVLDIDGDGEITDWDGVLLDRYLAGWDIKIS